MPTARSRPPTPRTQPAPRPLNPTAAPVGVRGALPPAGLAADPALPRRRPERRPKGGTIGSEPNLWFGEDVHFLAPFFTSAPVSSGGGSGTVSIHSPSRSLSCNRSAMFDSEYSNSGVQKRASNGQTSTQMPQYMHSA